ncbi:MAG: ZIP family metal transporter [Candidatus Omnitrophica bacterium]|nr:ZIP family metal transporter [Candidatus Omnitrophota bacterium]
MPLLFWVVLSTFAVSLASFAGVITFLFKAKILSRIIFYLIGFSAGALIGGAFLHILPEALKDSSSSFVFNWLIGGLILFFLLERYLYWRHCHVEGQCQIHCFSYLNLIGDGLHNFLDGIMITASYMMSFQLGVTTTVAVLLHELPQELSDFGVLVYGGFSPTRALLFNFGSAVLAVLGALVGYVLFEHTETVVKIILPLTAGGFIYIATSDLIPEIHKERNLKRSTLAFIAFLLGIGFMAITKIFLEL